LRYNKVYNSRVILVIMHKIGTLLVLLISFNILIFSAYYLYQNLPGETQEFRILGRVVDTPMAVNVSNDVSQFYPNMRFNHNDISYYIEEGCNGYKVPNIKEAFAIIRQETDFILDFHQVYDDKESDILIGCSPDSFEREENLFIVGEGGPTRIVNSTLYPIILKGKVLLYNESACEKPITELHELLHVFGFDHINDSSKVMYPYVNCNQDINPNLSEFLKELYSIEPMAELYISNISANKSGRYFNFDILLKNKGMIDAKDVDLYVYSEEELLERFELGNIEFGGGKSFYVRNLLLPNRDTSKIIIKINSRTQEQDDKNNVLELEI